MITYSVLAQSRSIALDALRRNILQSVLTITGMTIGVGTVLTMVALGTGAQNAIQNQVRSAGKNVILVSSGNYRMKQQWTSDGETEEQQAAFNPRDHSPPLRSAVWTPSSLPALDQISQPRINPILGEQHDPENAAGLGASQKLSLSDADAVSNLPGVQYVSAGIGDNSQVFTTENSWYTRVHGESASLPGIRRAWILRHGTFFTPAQVRRADNVTVIGTIVSQHLFGSANPIGKLLRIKGTTFRVIGEISSGNWIVHASQGDGQFDAVYIPVTAAQRLLHRNALDTLTISTASTGEVTTISKEVTSLLRARHELTGDQPDDFTVATEAHQSLARGGMRTDVARAVVGNVSYLDKLTLDELGKTLERASRTMTFLLASIAGVSLVVGGIGIMNIMLFSVTQRTREIGVRRAVGARSADVLLQFLMEAVLLSLCGGFLGILAGWIAARAITSAVLWTTTISLRAMALSFGSSALVGIVFGLYPARQASRVTPMTSLRYE